MHGALAADAPDDFRDIDDLMPDAPAAESSVQEPAAPAPPTHSRLAARIAERSSPASDPSSGRVESSSTSEDSLESASALIRRFRQPVPETADLAEFGPFSSSASDPAAPRASAEVQLAVRSRSASAAAPEVRPSPEKRPPMPAVAESVAESAEESVEQPPPPKRARLQAPSGGYVIPPASTDVNKYVPPPTRVAPVVNTQLAEAKRKLEQSLADL